MCFLIQASLEDLQSKEDVTLKYLAVPFVCSCFSCVCVFYLFWFSFKLTYFVISDVTSPFGEKIPETSPAAVFSPDRTFWHCFCFSVKHKNAYLFVIPVLDMLLQRKEIWFIISVVKWLCLVFGYPWLSLGKRVSF